MKRNFYKYVIKTYSNQQSPKGDFANDMKKDYYMPNIKEDEKVFWHLDNTMMSSEVREIYNSLKQEYLILKGDKYE